MNRLKQRKKLADEFEYGFVADNLRMITSREIIEQLYVKVVGKEYNGTGHEYLASVIASNMEGVNGVSWQYSVDEVVEMIKEIW